MDPDIIKKIPIILLTYTTYKVFFLEDTTYDTNTTGGNESWS